MLTESMKTKAESGLLSKKTFPSLWCRHKQHECGGACVYCRMPLQPKAQPLAPLKTATIKYSRRQLRAILKGVIAQAQSLSSQNQMMAKEIEDLRGGLVKIATPMDMERMVKDENMVH